MQLSTDNNETEIKEVDNRPNPNDELFGGIAMDEPFEIKSTYVPSTPKNSSPSPVIVIAIIAIVALILGGVIMSLKKADKEARKFDGTYILTKMEAEGMELDMESFNQLTGATFDGSVKIDGKKGNIQLNLVGAGKNQKTSGSCKVELQGETIKITGPGGSIFFQHGIDETGEYVSFEEAGCVLYFYKQ